MPIAPALFYVRTSMLDVAYEAHGPSTVNR